MRTHRSHASPGVGIQHFAELAAGGIFNLSSLHHQMQAPAVERQWDVAQTRPAPREGSGADEIGRDATRSCGPDPKAGPPRSSRNDATACDDPHRVPVLDDEEGPDPPASTSTSPLVTPGRPVTFIAASPSANDPADHMIANDRPPDVGGPASDEIHRIAAGKSTPTTLDIRIGPASVVYLSGELDIDRRAPPVRCAASSGPTRRGDRARPHRIDVHRLLRHPRALPRGGPPRPAGRLVVSHPTTAVRRALELTGLDVLLDGGSRPIEEWTGPTRCCRPDPRADVRLRHVPYLIPPTDGAFDVQ